MLMGGNNMENKDASYSARDLVRLLEIIYNKKKLKERRASELLSNEYQDAGKEEGRHKGAGNYFYYTRPIVEAVIKNRDYGITDEKLRKAFNQFEYERLEYERNQWLEKNTVPSVENFFSEEEQRIITALYLDDYQNIQGEYDVDVEVDKIVNHFPYLKLEIMLNKLLEIANYSFDSKQLLSDLIVDKRHEMLGDFDENHDILGIEDAKERLKQPNYGAYFSEIEINKETKKRKARTDQTVGFKR